MSDDQQHWQYETFKATRGTAPSVTFPVNPDGSINNARLAAVSPPLADFSFDHQDLLLKPAEKKP